MYVASAHNTAKGYRQIVPDTGIDLKRKFEPKLPVSKSPDPRDEEIRRLRKQAGEAIIRANEALARMRDIEEEYGLNRKAYRPLISTIERRICRVMRISRKEMHSKRRPKPICFARQAVFYWAIRLTLHSYPEVGRRMGGRDHTTVMHGARAYREKRAKMGRTLRPAR